jgi:hypothetical protein
MFPVAAQLIYEDGRTDRRTDVTKLIDTFRDCTKEPKKLFNFLLISSSKIKICVLLLCFRILAKFSKEILQILLLTA